MRENPRIYGLQIWNEAFLPSYGLFCQISERGSSYITSKARKKAEREKAPISFLLPKNYSVGDRIANMIWFYSMILVDDLPASASHHHYPRMLLLSKLQRYFQLSTYKKRGEIGEFSYVVNGVSFPQRGHSLNLTSFLSQSLQPTLLLQKRLIKIQRDTQLLLLHHFLIYFHFQLQQRSLARFLCFLAYVSRERERDDMHFGECISKLRFCE